MKEVYKPKRTFAEKLLAQWPGFLGALFICIGLGIVWHAYHYPPHRFNIRTLAVFIGLGITSLGYWALATD